MSARTFGIDSLTSAEVAFFKQNGFLFFPGALDPEKVRAARDCWWECVPKGLGVAKDDPASWIGGFTGADPDALARHAARTEEHDLNAAAGVSESNAATGLGWRCRQVGGTDEFLDMLPRACWGAAEQLCGSGALIYPAGDTMPGGNFAHPGANVRGVGSAGQACRGVYANLPPTLTPDDRAAALNEPISGGHVDGWDGDRWRFSVNTTLDDTAPGDGAFSVWPGSHLIMHPQRHWQPTDQEATGFMETVATAPKRVPYPAYNTALEHARATIEPVELCGPAGSVIFWHHRLMHSGSRNRGVGIRSGVIFDFCATLITSLSSFKSKEQSSSMT